MQPHIMKHWQSTDHPCTIASAEIPRNQRTFSVKMLKSLMSFIPSRDPRSLLRKHPRVHVQASSIRDDYAQHLCGGDYTKTCTN